MSQSKARAASKGGSAASSSAPTQIAAPAEAAPTLSKSVMSMKFMQRREPVSAESEKNRLLHLQGGDWMKDEGEKAIGVASSSSRSASIIREHQDAYSALPGRRSWGGANKAVEKHYHSVVVEKYDEKLRKNAANDTIDDEEMVKRYQQLVGLPRGPNQGKKVVAPNKGKAQKRTAEGDGYINLEGTMSLLQSGGAQKNKKRRA